MKNKTKTVVYIALYSAIFVLLDYMTNLLNLFRMPQGGSLSLATVALVLCSYHMGWKNGLICSAITVLLMVAIGSVTYYGIVSFLLDYLLGYMVYGFSSLFPNYKKIFFGIIITSVVRLILSTISGIVVWQTPFWTSLIYNGEYLIPTMIVDLVLVPLLLNRLKPLEK